jgi:hypothetical protein
MADACNCTPDTDHLAPPYAADVEPAWVDEVRRLLRDRHYTQQAQREVIDHAKEHGSVECCDSLEHYDRFRVEAMLPEAPPSAWHAVDRMPDGWQTPRVWVWEVTNTDFCLGSDCGCRLCQEEARETERLGAYLAGHAVTL